jgi:hypothetical protein
VAADECGVNAIVYCLLKGFLARSAWLYAILGVASYMMSGGFWALRIDRIPLVGMWLGLWGGIAAFNARSLVWRSLPIAISDIAQYRWWASVGAPGCFITVITLLSWGVQLSARLPAPAGFEVLKSVVVNWSILALVAACWDEIRYPSGHSKSAAAAKTLLLVALCVLLTSYGLPNKVDTFAPVWAFVSAGLVLLMLGVLRARRATDKRWVYAVRGKLPLKFWSTAPKAASGPYGVQSFYAPLMRYTVALTTAAIVGLVVAHIAFSSKTYPKVDRFVLLTVLVGLSTSSSVLNYRLRTSMQPLRCLPLSANRLAMILQIIGSLPGMIAAILTLQTARFLLQLPIDVWASGGFALIFFSSFGLIGFSPKWQGQPQYRGVFVQHWLPVIQGSLMPGYIGLVFVNLVEDGVKYPWLRAATNWIWLPLGIFCFGVGHYALLRYLRAGIRPSTEQNAFSGG